ncbi:MAG: hypothetical protein J6L88_08200, partial [Clostridia bacterium]|nr:hypothetical protein [Clostridia bacterium]
KNKRFVGGDAYVAPHAGINIKCYRSDEGIAPYDGIDEQSCRLCSVQLFARRRERAPALQEIKRYFYVMSS